MQKHYEKLVQINISIGESDRDELKRQAEKFARDNCLPYSVASYVRYLIQKAKKEVS